MGLRDQLNFKKASKVLGQAKNDVKRPTCDELADRRQQKQQGGGKR